MRGTLNWALSNNLTAGESLVSGLISAVQGYGGFRPTSSNYCGSEAITNLTTVFAAQGWDLSLDGALQPRVLDSLTGKALTSALQAYADRARRGSLDSPLLAGTAKDLLEATAAQGEAKRRREGVVAQTRRSMLDLQQEANQKEASLIQELAKAQYQETLTLLRASVDGTVQQLAVHTVGGVVTPAQQLMVIVPSNQPVEVEAMLEKKDVGFVRIGQSVTVKVETFTFTKYGTVEGEAVSISNDAIEDEKRGRTYSSSIRLKSDGLMIKGQRVALTPGMSVTAEVKTDQRRVIDYFLSPLQLHVDESLRER